MKKGREDLLRIWQERIEELEKSSLSVIEYSRRNSLNLNQCYYWFRKVRNLKEVSKVSPENCLTEVIFASEESCSCGLKVSFSNGIEIIPERDFSEYEFLRLANLVRSM